MTADPASAAGPGVRLPLLAVDGLTKTFGALVASDAVSLDVGTGEVHAVIGPNGAGKTTLLAQIAGTLRPDRGRVRLDGADITGLAPARRARLGLARCFQVSAVLPELTARENVSLALLGRIANPFRTWRRVAGDPALTAPAEAALAEVGLDGLGGQATAALAHGQRRQLELAMALAGRPRLVLLDEPTAGMGGEDTGAMIRLLAAIKGRAGGRGPAMLLVEHDMDVVFSLADRITVLVRGRVLASGPPAEIAGDADVRAAYLGEDGGSC